MSKWLSAVTIALVVAAVPACATKKFVRQGVKGVNDKVETLSQSVEETQERTRRNEGAISEVDQKTKAAQTAADRAQQAAIAAHADARAAGDKAAAVGVKADDLDKASRRLVYTVVLSEDQGQFKLGKADLPDDAKARLDGLVAMLKADPNGAYFEIEGHTDSLGTKAVNTRIGLERAEAVKRYLFEQHQIPLHRMNVLSYGMEKPVASNKTRDGRAQNRRVVIRVLA
jgi:peptidoglycan-associated lipoprotein